MIFKPWLDEMAMVCGVFMKKQAHILLAATAVFYSGFTFACASCGCSLSSDWESQGLSSGRGLRFDLRYDYLNQNQVRSGTGTVANWPVAGHEQETYTKNDYVTAGIDYSWNDTWGISVQLPYIDRSHGTNGFAYDGTDAGTSHSSSLGDIKIMGRYAGFSADHSVGFQFGLKLPTGSYTENFSGGPIAGNPLDRGLQPGTGTTDAILGVYKFASISQNWDYFSQATAQIPLNSQADYKPGQAINVNLGYRFLGLENITPQIQINARVSAKDSGLNASPDDSGGQTVYLSPGLTFPLTEKIKGYTFIQVPIYQNLNGYQLAPTSTASIGLRAGF
ncbi:TonB-dependent receptor [Leptothrix ochracea]|uniref:TonB-dependent receptor n=2 Tax=Leptothrix ochracea TaxID=735331 RepID=UPI0034E250EB